MKSVSVLHIVGLTPSGDALRLDASVKQVLGGRLEWGPWLALFPGWVQDRCPDNVEDMKIPTGQLNMLYIITVLKKSLKFGLTQMAENCLFYF